MMYSIEEVDHKGLWTTVSQHMSLSSAVIEARDRPVRIVDENGQPVWLGKDVSDPPPERRRDPAAMLQIFCGIIMARPGLSYENAAKQAVEAYDELEKHG